MLTLLAIYRPWRDLYESLKSSFNSSFLLKRHTYEMLIESELSGFNLTAKYYWYMIYIPNLIVANIINFFVFYPFRLSVVSINKEFINHLPSPKKSLNSYNPLPKSAFWKDDKPLAKSAFWENNKLFKGHFNKLIDRNIKEKVNNSKQAINQFRIKLYLN